MDEATATAYHEAGHAIVAREFGYEVGLVEINEDGLTGMCRFKMPAWDESTPAGRRRQLAVLVAGRIAERRLAGRVVSADTIAADFTEDKDVFGDWFDEDEQDDAAQVWELIEASDEAPAELLHEAAEAAVSILEERWAEVEELAKGLGG
jgi:hypothetical protein